MCIRDRGDIEGALEAYLHADLVEENNTWILNRVAYCYRVLKEAVTALEFYRRVEQLSLIHIYRYSLHDIRDAKV